MRRAADGVAGGGPECPTRNLHIRDAARVALQQSAAEILLQIRCRMLGGVAQRQTHRTDLSRKIMDFKALIPDDKTSAREICCLFFADSAKPMISTQSRVAITFLGPDPKATRLRRSARNDSVCPSK